MPAGVTRVGVGGMGKVSDVPVLGGLKADKGRRGMSLPPLRRGVMMMVKSKCSHAAYYRDISNNNVMQHRSVVAGATAFVGSTVASSPTISAPVFATGAG